MRNLRTSLKTALMWGYVPVPSDQTDCFCCRAIVSRQLRWRPTASGQSGLCRNVCRHQQRRADWRAAEQTFLEKCGEAAEKAWHDQIFVFDTKTQQWQTAAENCAERGLGVSATWKDMIICAGGAGF